MIVIPAINETSFVEVGKKMRQAEEFGASWVHLDVSDGKFTPNLLWNNQADMSKVESLKSKVKFEVHLMVKNPEEALDGWLDAGVKRVIIHIEAIDITRLNLVNEVQPRVIQSMRRRCDSAGVEIFLACSPETSIEELLKYKDDVDGFLILAVTPGNACQKFKEDQLEKIRSLREKFPNVKIEVDGGVNLENALAIKNAGADILVSASAIWDSENPSASYKKLSEL